MVAKLKIGVLALQGDVIEHIKILKALKVFSREVRLPKDLQGLDGLIIPGGESTTISKLLRKTKLDSAIKSMHKNGMALFGTCAGAIILAKKISDDNTVKPLGLIDITVQRNAYGPQKESFEAKLQVFGLKKPFPVAFIRAPVIKKTGKKVNVLCKYQKKPVLVLQGHKVLASTFHTELEPVSRALHQLFLSQIEKNRF